MNQKGISDWKYQCYLYIVVQIKYFLFIVIDNATYALHPLQYTAANIWNDIPDNIKMIESWVELKSALLKHNKKKIYI